MSVESRKLWEPSAELLASCNLTQFTKWLGKEISSGSEYEYDQLWQWSTDDVGRFWRKLLDYFDVQYDGDPSVALTEGALIEQKWFPQLELNYAEHIFRSATVEHPAMVCIREEEVPQEISWDMLRKEVAAVQQVLAKAGVQKGDRVVGFLPNTEHAVIAFLATAGLGAVWSCCSPDFGAQAVLDRFSQIEPKVLIACLGYGYGGKYQDRQAVIEQLAANLPTLEHKILVDLSNQGSLEGWQSWDSWEMPLANPIFLRLEFNHPLWILYSSGTTGKPKAIVHGHGGCLLEHYKYLHLQADVRRGERFFWFTTTGWMMWNFLQASMLVGAVPVLYDGSPGYPGLGRLWRMAANLKINHFGTSAPYIHACLKSNIVVIDTLDLSSLRSIGSTGAPLSTEGFSYIYERIKADVWLTSMSGGTDVCTAFVGGNPWSPVHEGWIQGRALGCDLHAYDARHEAVIAEEGELIVRKSMPSMPVMFWNDADGHLRRESYFEEIPGVWRHGDWITLNAEREIMIHGRSDATLNRQGVRIGTAEIYRELDQFAEVRDALVINYVDASGEDHMPLFVVLAEGEEMDDRLRLKLKRALREGNSPRHVPSRIEAVPDIPYTISGKKLETPVKRLFLGKKLEHVANIGAVRNPDALRDFAQLAALNLAGK